MKTHATTWISLVLLAVLGNLGPSICDGAGADRKDAPRPLAAEIVKAWRDAGAEVGWMQDVPPQSGAHNFWEPWRKQGEAGAIPAFRFPEKSADGVLAKLPDPGTAFGLDFHCGFYAGVTLKELATLKNLHSLCIGGVQGDAYADLKDLAGMTSLRGLYLFYLPVTDAQLKHLAGLKNLQVLDLYHTRVTDAGLKQLAGLKSLRWLNLDRTNVTAAGVAALEKELPDCRIISSVHGLEQRVQKLLEMQKAVHDDTVALAKVIKATPADRQAALKLLQSERDIVAEATKTLDMLSLSEEGAAAALVELFQQLRENMLGVQRRLQATDVGAETQTIQREIIDTLKEMIEALNKPAPGGARHGSQPDPEQFKTALLAMMRSKAGQELGWFKGGVPDEMAKMTIEEEKDGWFAWTAAFRFNPSKAIYALVIRPKPGVRASVFEYEGSFVKKDGVWVASPPRLVRTVLQSGE